MLSVQNGWKKSFSIDYTSRTLEIHTHHIRLNTPSQMMYRVKWYTIFMWDLREPLSTPMHARELWLIFCLFAVICERTIIICATIYTYLSY